MELGSGGMGMKLENQKTHAMMRRRQKIGQCCVLPAIFLAFCIDWFARFCSSKQGSHFVVGGGHIMMPRQCAKFTLILSSAGGWMEGVLTIPSVAAVSTSLALSFWLDAPVLTYGERDCLQQLGQQS